MNPPIRTLGAATPTTQRLLDEMIDAAIGWADQVVLADESDNPRHRAPVYSSRRLKNAIRAYQASTEGLKA